MPSHILQENTGLILLEDNSGALLQEAVAVVGPGTVTIVDFAGTVTVTVTEAAQPSLTLTGPVTGTLTLKDGAA